MKTISVIKNWMSLATSDEQELLAHRCGTSRGYLYQLSGGHRQASADLGAAIEREQESLYRYMEGKR